MIVNSKSLNIYAGGNFMIVMRIKLDHIYSFNNFEVDFTYPKKVKNSLVREEYLSGNESFRYKKVNIFIGSNASGKTTLIKSIWSVIYFLNKKESISIERMINKNFKKSTIEMDFVTSRNNKNILNRVIINTINSDSVKIKMAHKMINLTTTINYEKASEKLDEIETVFKDYLEVLNECKFSFGWYTSLPITEAPFDEVYFENVKSEAEEKEYIHILTKVLSTLDPSILFVRRSRDSKDAYVINHKSNNSLVIPKGMKLADIPLLSSGTKNGINIANVIYSIKKHQFGVYLIDEQFSFMNSEIEASLIATMVSLLGTGEQIFITTHNTNILSLSFPIHSFYFLRKNKYESDIEIACASKYENRNNVLVKNLYDNDLFSTAPNVSGIFSLGEKYEA